MHLRIALRTLAPSSRERAKRVGNEEERRRKDYRVGGKVEGERRRGGYVNDREIATLLRTVLQQFCFFLRGVNDE